ncbi:SpoIIE family protein phosphatase [Streptomyces sp. NPDC002917]|uniref:SpoIIE family protein phosphatase n=1 Tax=unclassified Streptomyces TaxID=2593676 RepID=UPI002E805155|nr:SpoIIE family protein phosphatase [Streptomyces sp. NBC_00562]WUC23335.1 SpoIIE family protein phosphatase [Streptomyces sp. NBC_00562]
MAPDTHHTEVGSASGSPFAATRAAGAVMDARGVLVGWSAGAEQLLGYEAAEVLGQPAASLLATAGRAAFLTAAPDLSREAAQGRHVGATLRCKDGRELAVALRAHPWVGPDEARFWLLLAAEEAETRRWEEDLAVLSGLFDQSPVGLLVSDTDLRCTRRNLALERMTGVPIGERLGKKISEALPDLNVAEVETVMERVLATGEPVLDFIQRGLTPADPSREHVWSTGIFRLQDSEGTVLGLCHAVVDITDAHRARERMQLINEASMRIGTTLDVGRTAKELAEVALHQLADSVTVDLLDSVLRGDTPTPTPGPADQGLTLCRAAHETVSESTRPPKALAVGELSRFGPASPQALCMADLEAKFIAHLDLTAPWLDEDPKRAAIIRATRVHSLIAVPLTARNVLMGVATFYRWRDPEPFDDDDVTLAAELASRAALSMDNARRYTRERNTALALQRSLLPQRLPVLNAVEVAGRYQPAGSDTDLGGDWFDVIPLSGARVALVVGDVPGHGVQASATMGRLRAAVHTLADLDLPPDELLTHLDDLVARLTEAEGVGRDQPHADGSAIGATCLYAVYDPAERRCTLASAGHYPPAVAGPGGSVDFPEVPAGPPLGLGGLPFETTELDLAEGSLLVLYTNGLILARDQDIDIGLDSLRRILSQPETALEDICDQLIAALLPFRPPDDVALLVARTRALGPDRVASWDLPLDPAIVVDARAAATRQLGLWGLQDLAYVAELVVSELVTNAIRYGKPPIRLRLIHDQSLICEVSDGNSTAPHLRRAHTDDEGGRGLFLVAQLTDHWGTRYAARGKIIWAELGLSQ